MPDKILQVVIYEDEDKKLAWLAEEQERSKSAMVRYLINREYARLAGEQAQRLQPGQSERG